MPFDSPSSSKSHSINHITAANTVSQSIKLSLALDKLTMLLDYSPQWGGIPPSKEDAKSFYIGIVADTSNQSHSGISRFYGKGTAGYAVSIAGRVPKQASPLIWTNETAYVLQIAPKNDAIPFFRLDINPQAFTPRGLDHLRFMLDDVFNIGWLSLKNASVTRFDTALDLHGVSLNDFMWDIPNRPKRTVHSKHGEVETLYLGGKQGSPMVIYDKARQQGIPPDVAHTRVEARHCNKVKFSEIVSIACPFERLKVFNATMLPGTVPDKKLIALAGKALGLAGILRVFPPETHKNVREALDRTRPEWWRPDDIWKRWPEILAQTLPDLVQCS
jgi:hypothetical protein